MRSKVLTKVSMSGLVSLRLDLWVDTKVLGEHTASVFSPEGITLASTQKPTWCCNPGALERGLDVCLSARHLQPHVTTNTWDYSCGARTSAAGPEGRSTSLNISDHITNEYIFKKQQSEFHFVDYLFYWSIRPTFFRWAPTRNLIEIHLIALEIKNGHGRMDTLRLLQDGSL
jgi:hypothetical protein